MNADQQPSAYILVFIVGTVINIYGQFLVPAFRGNSHPLVTITREFETNSTVFLTSVVIAYLFPLFVGMYSSVRAQYKLRHSISKAEFPDSKPDPVFRGNVPFGVPPVSWTFMGLEIPALQWRSFRS